MRHNLNHGLRDLKIFEIGHVFRRRSSRGNGNSQGEESLPDEPLMLGLAATGLARGRHWSQPDRAIGFYDIKGTLEEVASRLRTEIQFSALNGAGPFSPGSGARILCAGEDAGRIGTLSKDAAEKIGIKAEVYLAEINLRMLFDGETPPLLLAPINRFPSASRDLALVVKQGTTWADIARTIRAAGGEIVSDVSVFDRYTGSSLPRDHASLAVNVIFQSTERTLQAVQVQEAEKKILAALRTKHGIILRT